MKHNKKIDVIEKKLEQSKRETIVLSITGDMRVLYPDYKDIHIKMAKLEKGQVASLKERLNIHS
jgi:hypothetical protein